MEPALHAGMYSRSKWCKWIVDTLVPNGSPDVSIMTHSYEHQCYLVIDLVITAFNYQHCVL